MNYTVEEKYGLIKEDVLKSKENNPLKLILLIMTKDYISINGPEHHFLDGACFLAAYKNSGGKIDLVSALEELEKRSIKIPGAICGYWGICGAVASLGASLSIINKVSPLSSFSYYKDDMEYTSSVLSIMSHIGGPRCCKRNAFISLINACKFVNNKYGVNIEYTDVKCGFYSKNKECIKEVCPFYPIKSKQKEQQ